MKLKLSGERNRASRLLQKKKNKNSRLRISYRYLKDKSLKFTALVLIWLMVSLSMPQFSLSGLINNGNNINPSTDKNNNDKNGNDFFSLLVLVLSKISFGTQAGEAQSITCSANPPNPDSSMDVEVKCVGFSNGEAVKITINYPNGIVEISDSNADSGGNVIVTPLKSGTGVYTVKVTSTSDSSKSGQTSFTVTAVDYGQSAACNNPPLSGTCMDVSSCTTGNIKSGLCPGPASWQCCLPASSGGTDTTPPTVQITNPADRSTVSGTVEVRAEASDNVGVTRVEFYLDGVLKSTDTTTPYTWSWVADSDLHALDAIAYDAAGNNAGSQIFVNVDNGGSGSGSGTGTTTAGDFTISLSPTSFSANAQVSFKVTFNPKPDLKSGSSVIIEMLGQNTGRSYTYTIPVGTFCPSTSCQTTTVSGLSSDTYLAYVTVTKSDGTPVKSQPITVSILPSAGASSTSTCNTCIASGGTWCVRRGLYTPPEAICAPTGQCPASYGDYTYTPYNTCDTGILSLCEEACNWRVNQYAYGYSYGSGSATGAGIPIGICSDLPPYAVSLYIQQSRSASSTTISPPMPFYGRGLCQNANDICYCSSISLGTQTTPLETPVTPKTLHWPINDNTYIKDPPKKGANEVDCSQATDATIKAQITSGGSGQGSTLRVVAAGQPVTIEGEVGQFSNICDGYKYTCQIFTELGCKLERGGFLNSKQKLLYRACPTNLPNRIYAEGEDEKTCIGCILSAAIPVVLAGLVIIFGFDPATAIKIGRLALDLAPIVDNPDCIRWGKVLVDAGSLATPTGGKAGGDGKGTTNIPGKDVPASGSYGQAAPYVTEDKNVLFSDSKDKTPQQNKLTTNLISSLPTIGVVHADDITEGEACDVDVSGRWYDLNEFESLVDLSGIGVAHAQSDQSRTVRILFIPIFESVEPLSPSYSEFVTSINDQYQFFLNSIPSSCRSKFYTKIPTESEFNNFQKQALCPLDPRVVRDIAQGYGYDTNNFDVIVGVGSTVEPGIAGRCLPDETRDNKGILKGHIWYRIENTKNALAHEIGHLFGFDEQYCSVEAGSSYLYSCNRPYSINPMSASLGCDPKATSGPNACCGPAVGFPDCSSNALPCCLGNKVGNGRTIMSYASPDAIGFDSNELRAIAETLGCELDTPPTNTDDSDCVSCINSGKVWCDFNGNQQCQTQTDCLLAGGSLITSCTQSDNTSSTGGTQGTGGSSGSSGGGSEPKWAAGLETLGKMFSDPSNIYSIMNAWSCPLFDQEDVDACWSVCARDFETKPAGAPTCGSGSGIGTLRADETQFTCNARSCGGFASKTVEITVKRGNDVLFTDTTTTDESGKFSYTFVAPDIDDVITIVLSTSV